MEQKHIPLSVLSVGLGVSLGLGLASAPTVSRLLGPYCSPDAITEEQIKGELQRLVVDGRGRGSEVTFDRFPYFLSETTQELLTCVAYGYLRHSDFSKHTQNLPPGSRAILISGPAELYQQTVAKALAHFFQAKLLLLDVHDFSLKMQSKYGCPKEESSSMKYSILEVILGPMSSFLPSSILPQREEAEAHFNRTSNWALDEKRLLQSLYKVLVSSSGTCPIILYIRDVEKLLVQSERLCKLFRKMLDKLSGSVLVLGSRTLDRDDEGGKIDEMMSPLFAYNIKIREPGSDASLDFWAAQREEEREMIQYQENKKHIAEVLAANNLDCGDLGSISHEDSMILSDHGEKIVRLAESYHLMNNKDPEYRNGKLVISSKSLFRGLRMFEEGILKTDAESSKVPHYNIFEKHIWREVIPENQIGVTFDDIGALDDIKESLQDLVMLPLQRPDLFTGGLLKPCRGLLLFGPPGTGKTMLAKAIANEAGANFINVSMSTITSTWFGEAEKNIRALFTLAAKISPTIIFVDEVDSLLGQRTTQGEHECMRKIKNEFMTHWDGLLTKGHERVLVLAATNRPYDLDEASIRRFERRIMVGLPTVESREMILKTLLAKEKAEDLDFKELATMTEGYTGSDLKNLCTAAAYRPVRELLRQEREMNDKEQKADEGQSSEDASDTKEGKKEEEKGIVKRTLNMEDMRQAKNEVAASFASEGAEMNKLKQWNELYGKGGSRKKIQLTYFV